MAEDTECEVKVKVGSDDPITLGDKLNYKKDLVPMVTKVQPKSGGTKGGTLLTITGVRFRYIFSTSFLNI